MNRSDLEWLAERTAEILFWKLNEPRTLYISQRQAFKRYGEANVRSVASEIRTFQRGNRIEYYVPDLERLLKPKYVVK